VFGQYADRRLLVAALGTVGEHSLLSEQRASSLNQMNKVPSGLVAVRLF
jgi:hypothetical protein